MVPPIIMMTFQLMTENQYSGFLFKMPKRTKSTATVQMAYNLHSVFAIITTYIKMKSTIAIICKFILIPLPLFKNLMLEKEASK